MSEKNFPNHPFGFQSTRFTTAGVHPKNLLPGTFLTHGNETVSTSNDIGPGKYDPEYGGFSSVAVAKRAAGPGWKRQYELSHMLALPYLLNKEEWEEKKLVVRRLGPGRYEYKDFLELAKDKDVSNRGILGLRETRFKDTIASCTPGPGAYGIPHEKLEQRLKGSFSTKGMLDCATCGTRMLPNVGSHLGPGTYSFPDTVDEMLQKRISKRGPYDVFTPDRGKPILTGHLATLVSHNLGPGQYEFKSYIDEMQTTHKRHYGVFKKDIKYPRKPHDRIVGTTLALCPRDADDPGPGAYDPKDPPQQPLTQGRNLPPFNSSSKRADKLSTQFFTGNYNRVGPGRYDIQKIEDLRNDNGHQSSFVSKTKRPSPQQLKSLEERIREKSVPPERRAILVYPDEPKRCASMSRINNSKIKSGAWFDMNRRRATAMPAA